MSLKCFEFSCKHLVVCITADEHDEVELPEKSHFICVKREPCINSLFDDSSSWICTEVFVMKDHIVLNEGVLKLALVI